MIIYDYDKRIDESIYYFCIFIIFFSFSIFFFIYLNMYSINFISELAQFPWKAYYFFAKTKISLSWIRWIYFLNLINFNLFSCRIFQMKCLQLTKFTY